MLVANLRKSVAATAPRHRMIFFPARFSTVAADTADAADAEAADAANADADADAGAAEPAQITPTKIILPEADEASHVIEWHVAEGDAVDEGAALCDIETEELVYELDSPHDGHVAKIRVAAVPGAEGDPVPDGEALAYLVPDEDALEAWRTQEAARKEALADAERAAAAAAAEKAAAEGKCEVTAFLASCGLGSGTDAYVDALVEEGFDSVKALRALTEADLKELGVKMGHRRLILSFLDHPDVGSEK